MAIRIRPHDEYGFTFAYDADTRSQGIEEKLIEISRNSEQIRADLLAVFAGEDGVMNAEEIEAAEQFRQSNMDIASQNDYRDVLFINMVLLGELLDEQRATLNATASAEASATPVTATAEPAEDIIAGPVSVEGDVISVTTAGGLTFQLDYSHSDPLIGTDREYGFSLRVPNTPGVVNTRSVDSLGMDQVVDALRTNQIEILGAMSDILTTRVQQGDEDADIVIAADFDRVLRPLADQIEDYDGRIGEVIDAMTVVALRDATANFDTDTTSVTDTIGRNGQRRTITVEQVSDDSTAVETRDAFLNELNTGIFNNALAILEDNGFLDEAPELQPDTGPAVAGFQTADIQITIDISIENNTFIIIGAEGIPNDTVGRMVREALAEEAKGEDGELDPERLQALEDLVRDTAEQAGGDTYITNITQIAINQINVINLEREAIARAAEAEEAPEVVEEAAPAAEPAAPVREAGRWFYRGNSSDEIAVLQQALGVDETYRARLGDGWADWADGLIGSRTEGVIRDYADAHSIDPNTMSLEDFTNHVRDNLTADATLAAEIEAAEPVVETIVEAAERVAAEAAEEAAAEATQVAAETAILTDSNRVLHHEVIARAEALWEAATTDGSLAADAMLTTMDLGLFDGATPMLIREINGEIVVTQIHEGNADTLPETYQLSAALQAELLDETRRGRDYVEDNGVRVEVDPVTGGLNYDTLTITASHDNDFTSTFVRHANGGGTVYETDELADALDRYDGRANERGQYGEDLDNLEEALRDGEIEGLTVTFMDSGLVTIEGTTAEADAEGISIQIPQELYDRIMERANSDHAPAAQVGPAATNSIAPPTS